MTNNSKKCTKYEAYFVFKDEAEFLEHIDICEDCAAEHRKMQKVSSLLQEVKPLLKKKKRSAVNIKPFASAVAACFLIIAAIAFYPMDFKNHTVAKADDVTLEQMGFPVDEYGLIMVD